MRNKRQKPIINRDRIIESVYHIVYIGKVTRSLEDIFSTAADKLDQNEKNGIRFLIQSNVMIATISLLDEMSKFLFKCDNKIDQVLAKKIKGFKTIIEPILNSIDKWKGLRKFRNNVLAHNFRIDSDNFKSVFLNNELKNYVIPSTTMDLLMLIQYINQVTKIAEELFKSEYEEAVNIINGFEKPDIKVEQSLESETENVNRIILEVNRRIKNYNETPL